MHQLLASPELDQRAYGQLKLCEFDLEEVLTYLQTRRLTVEVTDDRVAEYTAIRGKLLELATRAHQLLREVTGPGHANDRPEDCPCIHCRDQVARWDREYQALPADLEPTAAADWGAVRR